MYLNINEQRYFGDANEIVVNKKEYKEFFNWSFQYI